MNSESGQNDGQETHINNSYFWLPDDGEQQSASNLDQEKHDQLPPPPTTTTDDVPHHQTHEWTPYLLYCNFIIILGSSFMFGYDLSVVNGPILVMTEWLNNSYNQAGYNLEKDDLYTNWSVAVTLYLFGGVVGSIWFPDAFISVFGKRNKLIIGAVVGFIGEMLIFIAPYTNSHIPFMVGRAVSGLQGGLSMVIAPALINEHVPPHLRGTCGTFFSLGIAIGLEVANLLGVSVILGDANNWHFLFLVVAVLYLIHGIGLFFVVESPRWLIDGKMEADAITALSKLRNLSVENVMPEFNEIKRTAEEESSIKDVSILAIFRSRELWWPMIIVIILHINNEMTGLSAVLIYATLIMNNAGLHIDTAAAANFGITFGMIIDNIICASLVERFGRRLLLLTGTMGLVVINIFLVITLSFNFFQASIAGFAVFLMFFTSGPGPVPWFMPAEMFHQSSRPLALTVAMFTNWVGNIIVSFTFPVMQLNIGEYSFLPFAVIGSLNFVFFLFFLPETTSTLANYTPEIFARGNSLVQFRKRRQQHDVGNNNHHHQENSNNNTQTRF